MERKMITGANVVSGDHATIIASQTIINYTVNNNNVNSNVNSKVNEIAGMLPESFVRDMLAEKDRQIAELLAIVRQLKSQSGQ